MKRKTLISVVLLIIMLLSCISPVLRVYATESSTQTITLNNELYIAVSTYMKSNYTGFAYNDGLRTITTNGSNFSDIETLNLEGNSIDDITGLDVFTGLKDLDISDNYLTLDSNLEVINNLTSLQKLDLSTNQIDGFNWLTIKEQLKGLCNLSTQTVEKVEIITIENPYEKDENGDWKLSDTETEIKESITKATEGLLAEPELGLLKNGVSVTTRLTDGKVWKWDAVNEKWTKKDVQESFSNTNDTDVIDYDNNSITIKNPLNNSEKDADSMNDGDTQKMFNINVHVTGSENPYFDSEIDLYYIVVFDDEEGIVFKDENFYKAVKRQLTAGQTKNPDLTQISGHFTINSDDDAILEQNFELAYVNWSTVIGFKPTITADEFIAILNEYIEKDSIVNEFCIKDDSGEYVIININELSENTIDIYINYHAYALKENLYSAAYDRALTLVISKENLRNKIPSIVADNEKIKDLTGLEKFIGIEENLSLTYNYIDSIERIIELEENKAKEEQMIRDEISAQINKMTEASSDFNGETTLNYREILKKYLDAVDAYETQSDAMNGLSGDELAAAQEKLKELESQKDAAAAKLPYAQDKLIKILSNMKNIWAESYNLATIQTVEVYEYNDPENNIVLDKEKAKQYFVNQLNKIKTLEQNGILDSNISNEILSWFKETTGYDIQASDNAEEDNTPISTYIDFYAEELGDLSQLKYIEFLKNIVTYENDATYTISNLLDKSEYYENGTDEINTEKLYKVTGLFVTNNPEMIPVVIKLPRLKNLDLQSNFLESIKGIDKLTKLEKLNLFDNLLTTIDDVDDWKQLEELNDLNLSKNQISNIDALSGIKNLNVLDVSDCLLSGVFAFDFIEYYSALTKIDFSGNYYTDLSFLIDNYSGIAAKENCSDLAEYITEVANGGIEFHFNRQKVNINYGNINPAEDEIITLDLPSIFADLEEMDPQNTSFGVVPGDGKVDPLGKTVSFAKYNSGNNTGKVTVKNIEEGTPNRDAESIGSGTTCYICYTVGGQTTVEPDDSTEPTTPTDPETPITPPTDSDNTNTDSEKIPEGTQELTAEDIVIYEDKDSKNFIYVYQPDATVASLAEVLNATSDYSVDTLNGSTDFENDSSRLYTSEPVTLFVENSTEPEAYEVVVIGDIDGDGDIDSIDSGYARALRYDSLYADIEDEAERSALMNAFEATSNFKAADFALGEDGAVDGSVDKVETRAILLYRAGLLDSFNGFAPKD